MDAGIPDPLAGAYTEITVRIPDELARHLGTAGEIDLAAHGAFGTYTLDDLERERRDLQRLGF